MPEQAAEAGVVEGGHLQKCLKTRRTSKVSLAHVIGAGLFIGMAVSFPPGTRDRTLCSEQSASFSPFWSNLLGV